MVHNLANVLLVSYCCYLLEGSYICVSKEYKSYSVFVMYLYLYDLIG